MADFRYTAVDRAGKQVAGTLTGRDVQDIAGKVRSLGYFPVEIASANGGGYARALTRPTEEKPRTAKETQAPASGKRVNRMQLLLFTRELADLIDAGLPID